MARSITNTSGSVFMGNPITYKVQAETETVGANITFHRVKLEVVINGKSVEMSTPAKSGEYVEFDISSAFRAMHDSYVYTPVTSSMTMPVYTAFLTARDVWMRDGVLIDPVGGASATVSTQYSAIAGAYSDFERRKPSRTVTFTRKPASGERVFVGDVVVCGVGKDQVLGGTGQQFTYPKSEVSVISGSDLGKEVGVGSGHTVYVDETERNSYQFQFVNSRGVVESIRSFQSEAEKITGSSEEHVVSRIETFSDFSRIISRKGPDRTELTLSSGFVSYEWARWWAYEFCHSSQHWILYQGVWVPCTVTRDDSATIIDQTKGAMCYVQFTCKPDLNGAMW